MTTTKDLLDAVKQTAGIESDYALAKELGVYKQLISSFYKGTRKPDNAMCLEIAKRIGQPLEQVITVVEMDAEKDDNRRELWKKYYKSIGGIAASIMLIGLALVTFIVTVPSVAAKESTTYDVSIPSNTNYALFRHKIRAAVLAVWNTLASAFLRPCFSG